MQRRFLWQGFEIGTDTAGGIVRVVVVRVAVRVHVAEIAGVDRVFRLAPFFLYLLQNLGVVLSPLLDSRFDFSDFPREKRKGVQVPALNVQQ